MSNSHILAQSEPRREISILELTRLLLGSEVDSASIGRIVHAAEQISQARDRIRTEYMIIGSHLADIHQTLYIAINKRLDNPTKARAQASRLLNDYASRSLQISKHTAIQYLQVYQRFVNSNEAIEFLNLGELTILKRSDISEEEVQLLVNAKKRHESFSRDEILPFIERYRAASDEVNTLMAALESAKEQLSNGLAQKTELELEIKYLRERATSADTKESEHREALAAAQAALDSQSHTVQSQRVSIDRLRLEKEGAEKAIAEMRVREVVREVKVEVVPSGYKSVSDAIDTARRELAETENQLNVKKQQLNSIASELLDRETTAAEKGRIEIRLAGLKADIDEATMKVRSATGLGTFSREHQPHIASIRDSMRALSDAVQTAFGD
ncbi:hypothetical protein [Cupriavidus basilensis]|uniref:hypothetical protein n=1 Tax=Cupriavidus basilensis TaxID=68895 RepID=UPI000750DD92|nr:hypothetical protein [Cupriavidus basilensis]